MIISLASAYHHREAVFGSFKSVFHRLISIQQSRECFYFRRFISRIRIFDRNRESIKRQVINEPTNPLDKNLLFSIKPRLLNSKNNNNNNIYLFVYFFNLRNIHSFIIIFDDIFVFLFLLLLLCRV